MISVRGSATCRRCDRIDARARIGRIANRHGNFVDHDRAPGSVGARGRRAFEDHRSARPHQFASARERILRLVPVQSMTTSNPGADQLAAPVRNPSEPEILRASQDGVRRHAHGRISSAAHGERDHRARAGRRRGSRSDRCVAGAPAEKISQAAASGSVKTADSSAMVSGNGVRFVSGSCRYSAKAPSRPRMPSTVRVAQWRPRPSIQELHFPHAALISPTTR